jgi:hypothetical protein
VIDKSMDALVWLRKQLETDDNDLLREMVRSFAEELMGADADAVCGAPIWGGLPGADQSPQRVPDPPVGHPSRVYRSTDPEAAGGFLFP